MNILRLFCRSAVLLTAILSLPAQGAQTPQQGMEQFVDQMVARHDMDKSELGTLLAKGKFRQEIIDSFEKSAERTWAWKKYRKNFLNESRIVKGVKFWNKHKSLFEAASKQFHIPQHILVAIVGVETHYGRRSGKTPVLDSLVTQAFHYPDRAKFGRKELEAFLLLGRDEGIDLEAVKGSYAGAVGKPQFIPTSYRNYSVDFDGDGRRDLWNSDADIIGSIANYFKDHGWREGEEVTTLSSGRKADYAGFEMTGRKPKKPSIPFSRLSASGITAEAQPGDDTLTTLIQLEGADGDEYWLGLHNFYVITRYNHSNLYAMAVYQLGEELLERYRAGDSQ
ncbi:MAG: lytic murein transglycosylase B [Sedimenticola sp.]